MGEQAVRVMRVVPHDPASALGEHGVGHVRFVDADGNPVVLGSTPEPPAMTAADAMAGTSTVAMLVSPQVLADEIDRRVAAAIAAIPAG